MLTPSRLPAVRAVARPKGTRMELLSAWPVESLTPVAASDGGGGGGANDEAQDHGVEGAVWANDGQLAAALGAVVAEAEQREALLRVWQAQAVLHSQVGGGVRRVLGRPSNAARRSRLWVLHCPPVLPPKRSQRPRHSQLVSPHSRRVACFRFARREDVSPVPPLSPLLWQLRPQLKAMYVQLFFVRPPALVQYQCSQLADRAQCLFSLTDAGGAAGAGGPGLRWVDLPAVWALLSVARAGMAHLLDALDGGV